MSGYVKDFEYRGVTYTVISAEAIEYFTVWCNDDLVFAGVDIHAVFERVLSDHDRVEAELSLCDDLIGDSGWARLMEAVDAVRGDFSSDEEADLFALELDADDKTEWIKDDECLWFWADEREDGE